MIIDVKRLNAFTIFDVYSLPLQSDIIAVVRDCFYISMIDCVNFFYQWRVHFSDRHKLTVINHREQESFNVTVMNYRNFPFYVQRQIDRLLKSCRSFVRAYIDDVIIFFKTKKDHLRHLKKMFQIFKKFNISVKSFKIFLAYSSIRLLNQKVNSLRFATNENKLKTINNLKFLITLRQLEHYLDLTDWFREYVKKYAKVVEFLQNRKTVMLKKSPFIDESIRRSYSSKTVLQSFIKEEISFYEFLQKSLFLFQYLIHFSSHRQLYINVDSSKKKSMSDMIYHSKQITDDYSFRIMIEPIMFFNRKITDLKSRYWFTELKLADLIWILRKIRHMIESAFLLPIIYTDHGAAVDINKQESLSTSFTNKLNLRLIRASEYIQRFNIIIRHKSGKKHVVSNALFRFKKNESNSVFFEKKLDALTTFVQNRIFNIAAFHLFSVVEISKNFQNRIKKEYKKKSIWIKIQDSVAKIIKNGIKTAFHEENGLLYLKKEYILQHVFQLRRFCLPQSVLKKVFQTVHDEFHLKFHKCYETFFFIYYIRDFTAVLKIFLKHCLQC